jgi:predicted  nucleic acid-binding Zn-ribbon protein
VRLHDLDLLLEEARAKTSRERGRQAGVAALEQARAQLQARLDRRWVHAYERAQQRYGRALVAVRDRVCQGCFITLPTSAAPSGDNLQVCESCGRILYWR